MAGAFPEYTEYVDAFIRQLREELSSGRARESLIGRLMSEDIGGEQLSARQLRALVFNLLLGGLTTTAQLLGNLIYELLTTGELSRLEKAEAIERSAFVEECLRVYPPVMIIPRGCVAETTVGGTTIKPGERVIVGTASANRDEQLFDDSEGFDPHRDNVDRHLTFGFGSHLCAGAAMARSVAGIGLGEFVAFGNRHRARLPDGFIYENVPTYFEYGPKKLPVVFGEARQE